MSHKKLCIVGFSKKSYKDAERFFGTDTDIWTLNQMWIQWPEIVPHVSAWFDLHSLHRLNEHERTSNHLQFLAQDHHFPIYMQEHFDNIPKSVEFPKDELILKFGRQFKSSISWMLALAIVQEYQQIHLVGVDMEIDSDVFGNEYSEQKPSCEYFIGYARGMGIEVNIPQSSSLCKCMLLYGYEDVDNITERLRKQQVHLLEKMDELAKQEFKYRDMKNKAIGAAETIDFVKRYWLDTSAE